MSNPTAICPRILPVISSIADTAESSTSTTRFDFSSTVDVSRYCPLVITDMNSSIMNAIGIIMFMTTFVARSPSAVTVRDCGRGTDVRLLIRTGSRPDPCSRAATIASRRPLWRSVSKRSSILPRTNSS